MNGIYDFENHHTPRLDVEMLLKRKAEKRARKMLVLAGIAALLMAILAVIMLYMCAQVSMSMFKIACMGLFLYVAAATIFIGKFVKRREYRYGEFYND